MAEMKTALIVRHVPREGAAGYLQPIEAAGYRIERIDVASADFADVDLCAPDLLIMMGGPMGVYEHDLHPWIPLQIAKLAARLEQDLPTLGVCLGSQMIAAALGAPVYSGGRMELGFAPVTLNRREPNRRCAIWTGFPFCTGTATRSTCRPASNCWPPPKITRIRPFAADPGCWRCNSTLKWAKIHASRIGSPISGPIST